MRRGLEDAGLAAEEVLESPASALHASIFDVFFNIKSDSLLNYF